MRDNQKQKQDRAAYTLFKNPIELDTLYIVQYLHSLGINMVPIIIIERSHPATVVELPCIFDHVSGSYHNGLKACVHYYEKKSDESSLLERAHAFKLVNPDYRIRPR